MKLDNRGWGLQELLIGLAVLFFGLVISAVLIEKNLRSIAPDRPSKPDDSSSEQKPDDSSSEQKPDHNQRKTYVEIENELKNATITYVDKIYGAELLEGDKISVSVKTLVRDGYLTPVFDPKNNTIQCSGYVTFIKEKGKIDYTPYLKCGEKYQTKGYLERLDDIQL